MKTELSLLETEVVSQPLEIDARYLLLRGLQRGLLVPEGPTAHVIAALVRRYPCSLEHLNRILPTPRVVDILSRSLAMMIEEDLVMSRAQAGELRAICSQARRRATTREHP